MTAGDTRPPNVARSDAPPPPDADRDVVRETAKEMARLAVREHQAKSAGHVTADVISRLAGSMPFALLNGMFFAVWIGANAGIAGLPAFDPYPFGALTVVVSLEAIFLSVFVLISQNRQAAASDKRAIVDMQMNTVAEREVTKVLALLQEIGEKLGVEKTGDGELRHILKRTDMQALADAADEVSDPAPESTTESTVSIHGEEPAA